MESKICDCRNMPPYSFSDQLFPIIETTGFPGSSVSKESACSAGDPSSISGQGRSPGEMSVGCVISSVLSRHSKDLKLWTSVTARLQLSFIQQAKDSTPARHEGKTTPKERLRSFLASSFYAIVPSPLPPSSLPCADWASQEGCLLHLRFSLQPLDFLLFHFHGLFPFFVFQPLPFWTLFSYSNYVTGGNGNPLQYSCLENPRDRGDLGAMVHAVTRVGHDLATNHHHRDK